MALLTLRGVGHGFDGRTLFRDVDLTIAETDRIGLLGANGAGKSTLLKILAGQEEPDEGERTLRRGLRINYLEQEPEFDPEATVRDGIRGGLEGREQVLADIESVHAALGDGKAEGAELSKLLKRQTQLEQRLEGLGGYEVEHRVEELGRALGLRDLEASCRHLSGGERRRVALARLLLSGPELVLLDEPTNHLDVVVTDWLEDTLLEMRVPLVMVTHDRYVLDRVSTRILEVDRGKIYAYEGGYAEYLTQRAARDVREAREESTRQILLRRETAWIRRGPPARTSKSKARIDAYHKLVADVPTERNEEMELVIPTGPRLGSKVLELSKVRKAYGERVILPGLTLELGPGERLGIVGPNGAGKSTLIGLCTGEIEPDSGTVERGSTVRFGQVRQLREELDPEKTVVQEVAGESDWVQHGDGVRRIESFLDRLLFDKRLRTSKIRQLSGGEQNRVLLAKLLTSGGNVLLLDEPTNDLDLISLRMLEDALGAFPGAALVVSHDRWFLDRVATSILYLDGDGGARLHAGSMSSLLEKLSAERDAREAERHAKTKAASKDSGKGAARSAAKGSGDGRSPKKPKALAPWEKRELEALPDQIEALESTIAALDGRLADPAIYAEPKSVLDEVTAKREAAGAELDGLLERWELLAAQDEATQG